MSWTRGNKIWLLYYILLLLLLLLSFWTAPRVVYPESNNLNRQYLLDIIMPLQVIYIYMYLYIISYTYLADTHIFVRCTSEQYCCKFVLLLFLYFFVGQLSRNNTREKKQLHHVRVIFLRKWLCIVCTPICIYAGRLKSNFLFHKTIWRFLVCVH